MITFKDYSELTEAIGATDMPVALKLIVQYIKKKTGISYFRFGKTEIFRNSSGRGYGVRYFGENASSFRLNFGTSGENFSPSSFLSSADVWMSNGKGVHLEFDNKISLVKTLPLIVSVINGEIKAGNVTYTVAGGMLDESHSNESEVLTEARKGSLSADKIFDEMVKYVTTSPKLNYTHIWRTYKTTGKRIWETMVERYPDAVVNVGTSARALWEWQGTKKDYNQIVKDKETILGLIGATKVTASTISGKETYEGSSQTEQLENNRERLTFEQQLSDMANLLRMTLAGVNNACYIAGRGGIGKTYTTEQILAEGGLKDTKGYFKVTGSASAAGAYRLLYKYQNEIVVFDDADGIFDDKDSRNLLKAATDKKKVRKLNWIKGGKNVIDPEDEEFEGMEPADIVKQNLIPAYFEFTGKIIFISNLSLDKLDPDGALRTRGFIVSIDPTDAEIYDFMRKIAPKMDLEEGLSLSLEQRLEVVDMLERGDSKQSANLRKLERGLNMYAGSTKAGVKLSKTELTRMIEMYA